MRFPRKLLGSLAVLASLASQASAGPTSMVVVVHPSNANATLNKAQLGALYQIKTTMFPDGSSATPVNLSFDNELRKDFDRAVLNMHPDESKRYWIDTKIRSGTTPPPKLPSSGAVAHHVAKTPTAIGYVSLDDAKGLKVVARVVGGSVRGP